ncbi:porin [Phycisphaerales bacterium AB-hyl4]|uniref:Porin n=1 Tax=Natronomicrosphaera hydrolytica TaxID=3242702 RepID=A0ABV4U3Z9_9BACT
MKTTATLLGTGILFALAHNPTAFADDSTSLQRLEAELAALKTRVEAQDTELQRLRATDESDSWLDERRAEEVRALVNETLADADGRSQAVQAGYNRGYFIRSDDGNHELRLGIVGQVRYIQNQRREADDRDTGGFQFRRLQTDFQGHFINPNWTYRLRLDSSNGGSVSAAWAWIGYRFNDDLSIRVGQLKPSFLHEENVGAPNQLAAERSYTADYFTTKFAQGVQLAWQPWDRLRLTGTVHNGSYNARTDFNNEGTNIALTGRAEYLLVADDVSRGWRQFGDYQSWSGDQVAVLLGAAADYEWGRTRNDFNRPDVFKWTGDVTAKLNGFSMFGSITGQRFSADSLNGLPDNLDGALQWGAVVQAAAFVVPDKVELFGRYEWIDFDNVYYRNNAGGIQGGSRDLTQRDVSLLTVGANYYLHRHNAKLTFEVVYALDPVPVANTGQGLLISETGDQLAARAQLQFRF